MLLLLLLLDHTLSLDSRNKVTITNMIISNSYRLTHSITFVDGHYRCRNFGLDMVCTAPSQLTTLMQILSRSRLNGPYLSIRFNTGQTIGSVLPFPYSVAGRDPNRYEGNPIGGGRTPPTNRRTSV